MPIVNIKDMKNAFEFLFGSPRRMLLLCAMFLFFGLGLSGDLFRLVKLTKFERTLKNKIQSVQVQKKEIEIKIKESTSKEYIEREAFQRFDMTKEGDIIFVFNN